MGWRIGADVVVLVHMGVIVGVVAGGLVALRWPRMAVVHLPLALYGVVIEVVGFTCPLTPFEKTLRRRAGESGYDGGFVEHYVVPVVYPGELTPGVELTLAMLIVVANGIVYGIVLRARRRRSTSRSIATVGRSPAVVGGDHLPVDRQVLEGETSHGEVVGSLVAGGDETLA